MAASPLHRSDSLSAAQVGPDQVDNSAYYLLICPQNVVGNTIMDHLHGMVRSSAGLLGLLCLLAPVQHRL